MDLPKRTKRFLIISVAVIVFLALYTVAFQWYFGPPSKPDFDYQLSNKGQRETTQEIVDSLKDDNAAKYYLMACLEMTPIPDGKFYEDSCPELPEEISPENLSELEECITTHEPVFLLFEQGLERNHFFLPTEEPFEGIFNSNQFTRLARLVDARGELYRLKGQFREAAETYLDQLRFSADLYNNNSLGIALRGISSEYGAYRGLESLLAEMHDEEPLEGLLQELINIENGRAPVSQILQRDHVEVMDSFENDAGISLHWGEPLIDPGPGDYFLDTMHRTGSYIVGSVVEPIYKRRTEKFFEAVIAFSKEPYIVVLHDPLEKNVPTDRPMNILAPAIENFLFTAARRETERHGFIIKVALQLHKLRHGEYPESLGELSVSLPEDILIDPLSGNQFIYKKTADGYLFYSFGLDLDDDGGTPHEEYYDKKQDGDIVFEPPGSSAAESHAPEGEGT